MKKLTQYELTQKLRAHTQWLYGEGGERCELVRQDLSGMDFHDRDLDRIVLRDCNLAGANMRNCNLREADLRNSIFSGPVTPVEE